MIAYPNNNVQSIGDATVARIIIFTMPGILQLTPRKLDRYIKDGFIPAMSETESGGFSAPTFLDFEGFNNPSADSYALTVILNGTLKTVATSTGYDLPFSF